jgi:hypothetical protein
MTTLVTRREAKLPSPPPLRARPLCRQRLLWLCERDIGSVVSRSRLVTNSHVARPRE